MARPRTPTATHELSGAYKKNPQRRNDFEPKPTSGPGLPPDHLTISEREIWNEIINICDPGVFGPSDRLAIEIMAKLMNEFRTNYEEFTAAKLNRMETFLARFGMTPSDRSKVVVPPAAKTNIYDDIGQAH